MKKIKNNNRIVVVLKLSRNACKNIPGNKLRKNMSTYTKKIRADLNAHYDLLFSTRFVLTSKMLLLETNIKSNTYFLQILTKYHWSEIF